MSEIHVRSTTRGSTPCHISPCNSTQNKWRLKQLTIHCEATFTDPSTITIQINNHEGTAYDSILLQTSLATAAGVLNDLVWVPEQPISFVGKDRVAIIFTGVSSALPWAYDAAVEV